MRCSASAWRAELLAVLLPLLGACGDPPCVEVSTDCEPLYEPTFDNIAERTLGPSCASGGGCHDSSSPAAGLDLSDADTAYDALLDGRVEPGTVDCSVLITRLEAESDSQVMPPGGKLGESERCAIRQWVEAGAPR